MYFTDPPIIKDRKVSEKTKFSNRRALLLYFPTFPDFFVVTVISLLLTAESVKKLFQLLCGQRICGLVNTSERG